MSEAMLVERPTAMSTLPAWKRKQADIAWSQHRNEPVDRISEATRRDVRGFRRSLASSAAAVTATVLDGPRWRPLAETYLKKGVLGPARARALDRLRGVFAPAVVEACELGGLGGGLVVKWIGPHDGPLVSIHDDLSFAQSGCACFCFGVTRLRREIVSASLVSVETPEHALCRLRDRGGGNVDMAAAIAEAGDSFMRMNFREVVDASFRGDTLVLPGGGGYWLADLIYGLRDETIKCYARPRTWIRAEQAGLDQRPYPPASDPASSVLTAGWALRLGKASGLPMPLSAEEIEQLKRDYERSKKETTQ